MVLKRLLGLSGVAILCGTITAGAQTIEVWLDTGEIQLTHEDGTVTTLKAGEYSRCVGSNCKIELFDTAPDRPQPPGAPGRAGRLPRDVAAALQGATTPEQIAALIAGNFGLAGPLMREAAALGIASPAEIVALLAPGLAPSDFAALIMGATIAAPGEADAIAVAALGVPGATGPRVARALIAGLEASGHPPEAVETEIGEIVAALGGTLPGANNAIAEAIANATSNPDDTAETVQEGAQDIQTGTLAPDAGPSPNQGPPPPPALPGSPSETQNNPSGN